MKSSTVILCSTFLFGCAQTRTMKNLESYSKDMVIPEDTIKRNHYDELFEEDYKIMSQWTEEEKHYFYEHFVFSFEELEEELGIKLPPH